MKRFLSLILTCAVGAPPQCWAQVAAVANSAASVGSGVRVAPVSLPTAPGLSSPSFSLGSISLSVSLPSLKSAPLVAPTAKSAPAAIAVSKALPSSIPLVVEQAVSKSAPAATAVSKALPYALSPSVARAVSFAASPSVQGRNAPAALATLRQAVRSLPEAPASPKTDVHGVSASLSTFFTGARRAGASEEPLPVAGDSGALRSPALGKAAASPEAAPAPAVEKQVHSEEHAVGEGEWKTMAALAGACAAFGLAAFGLGSMALGPAWLPAVLYVASMAAGGYDALVDSVHDVPKGKLDIHFLTLAVAIGAAIIGQLPEGAMLLFLFSASHAIEMYAEHRTRKGIDSLLKDAPKTARIEKDGAVAEVPIEAVREGDILVLLPGSQIPVDAEVVSGRTTVDESHLTGESLPVTKEPGDMLRSGSFNKSGTVRARVLHPASESTLQKLTRLINEAQHLRAPSQRFTDKFGTPYTLSILGASALMFAALTFMGLPAFAAVGGTSAFHRAVTFLVVASPCALVLSIPSAILAAIARGAMQRILFRGGAAVEGLASADVVAMDKTGTLTTGELNVERIEILSGAGADAAADEARLLRAAASLERHSTHPVADAVIRHARGLGLSAGEAEDFQEVEGFGVKGRFEGRPTVVGRQSFLESNGIATSGLKVSDPGSGTMTLWIAHGGAVGRLLLRDQVRPESREVVARLKAMGKRVVMLTGDRPEVAARVAEQLGITEHRGGLTPDDKFKAIEAFKAEGLKVVMVGDGLNDAAALAAADVSVAMGGARRTDAALENGDVVLMRDSLTSLLTAFELSVHARRIIKVNLSIALGVILVMVASAIAGVIPLPVGMVIHESSTIVVCLLSMLLLALPLTTPEVNPVVIPLIGGFGTITPSQIQTVQEKT